MAGDTKFVKLGEMEEVHDQNDELGWGDMEKKRQGEVGEVVARALALAWKEGMDMFGEDILENLTHSKDQGHHVVGTLACWVEFHRQVEEPMEDHFQR